MPSTPESKAIPTVEAFLCGDHRMALTGDVRAPPEESSKSPGSRN